MLAAGNAAQVDDVPAMQAWDSLKAKPDSVLIDVRTQAEWAFVGLPDLSGIGKSVVRIEWQSFPDNQADPAFVDRLGKYLDQAGVGKGADLFFICRSGSRSRLAAEAMASAAYLRCHNVADGFEGPLDENRQRGTVAGWKAAKLPWVQG